MKNRGLKLQIDNVVKRLHDLQWEKNSLPDTKSTNHTGKTNKSDSIKDRNFCSSNDIKTMKKAAQLEEENIFYR